MKEPLHIRLYCWIEFGACLGITSAAVATYMTIAGKLG